MILPIRKIGDPILEKPCEEVNLNDFNENQRNSDHFARSKWSAIQGLIKNMIETARFHNAVGLAANQVGESLKIFIFQTNFNTQHSSENIYKVAINPSIIVGHETMFYDWEGCLSVPKIVAEVPRYPNITLFYYNEQGEKKKLETSGLTARVIQHEISHLQGKLFLENASKIQYQK